ncbi:hypothetical protein ACI1MP_31045 [Kitasatospora griseola]|uniref:hypothetical protein n=1 Tax=Kitasatospora griseola TaxID=2064 RepID=UPI003855E4FE
MTQPIDPADFPDTALPGPDTPVLLRRRLNPQAGRTAPSLFRDERWDLTPGLFEGHIPTTTLNFTAVPEPFRTQVRHYVWQMINHDMPRPMRHTPGDRPALRTISVGFSKLNAFILWLATRGLTSLGQVTHDDLEAYLDAVDEMEKPVGAKGDLLLEVRRLWTYQERVPEEARLPDEAPWNGDYPFELLGASRKTGENRTPRIHPDTMEPLLLWALRFVGDFADDIIAAHRAYLALSHQGSNDRARRARHGSTAPTAPNQPHQLVPLLATYLDDLRRTGKALPGRTGADGKLEPCWPHLVRILDTSESAFRERRQRGALFRAMVTGSGIPLDDAAYLDTPVTGQVHGRPWHGRITYEQAPKLARLLRTAATITVAYLSGMRPGEVLNLERGCSAYDEATGVWTLTGRHFKGVKDSNGNKIPEGEERRDPWTVIDVVARAVDAVERLHDHRLLFPVHLDPANPIGALSSRPGEARTSREAPRDIAAFITWVNDFCRTAGLSEAIPPDPHGAIVPARFRRTLAWHIVRRPRGLVAAAIQYAHVYTQVTLGYSGTYASGFPDEHAFEEWLARLDQLAEDERLLDAGEHVSGPAADRYRHRVREGNAKFAGRVLTNPKQARDLVANPLLQIYPGRAMTCVHDAAKALCRVFTTQGSTRQTPDQDDCRPTCQNIAYTDRDIAERETRARELRFLTADVLAPSPRHQRERAELQALQSIIDTHHRGRGTR